MIRRALALSSLCLGLFVACPAAAQDAAPVAASTTRPFDLAAWALDLDPDRPAGGDYVVYERASKPDAEKIAALRRSLFASSPRVAEPAAEDLGLEGVPHGESVLLELARSERWAAVDDSLRATVLRGLRSMRSGRALPVYARVALREEGAPAREAIRALCESLAPEAVPVLRDLAGGPDARKRNLVVRFLRKTGEREAAKEVRRLRKEAKQEQRRDKRDEKRERREQRRGR